MKIADQELDVAAPVDLEQRVHALTGASAAEVRGLLDKPVIPGFVAKALHPFLVETMEIAALAQRIAEHGVDAIRADVAKLYDEATGSAAPVEPVEPAEPESSGSGSDEREASAPTED